MSHRNIQHNGSGSEMRLAHSRGSIRISGGNKYGLGGGGGCTWGNVSANGKDSPRVLITSVGDGSGWYLGSCSSAGKGDG